MTAIDRMAYMLHFHARRLTNYLWLHTFLRLKYNDALSYKGIASNQSYTRHSIEFLKKELSEHILSSGSNINANSVVMDVGGDTGVWATQIHEKYAPHLKIYEPNPKSLKVLRQKFQGLQTEIYPFGLGASNRGGTLSDHGMGSSTYASSPAFDRTDKFDIEIRDIAETVSAMNIPQIDLIKINIEGGEYEILPRMIEAGLVTKFKVIRVQFHDWIPCAFAMRRKIVRDLSKTHAVEWSYPMVWESWVRRG